jgi:hypothetical protein
MHGTLFAHQPQDPIPIAMDKIRYRGEALFRQGILIARGIGKLGNVRHGLKPDGIIRGADEPPVVAAQAKRIPLRDAVQFIPA